MTIQTLPSCWLHRWIGVPAWLLFGLIGCGPAQPASDRSGDGNAVQKSSDSSTGSHDVESIEASNSERSPRSDDWFEDVTDRTGIRFAYHNGQEGGHFTLLETVGGGVAMLDYDRDGDLDLYLTGGGTISGSKSSPVAGRSGALYRNDGDWKFTDVTASAGLNVSGDYSHGCDVADFDRDGWPDLFVTCYGQCQLFHNERNGQFREMAVAAGIVTDEWHSAAAWGDIDRDGWPDLYVAAYVRWKFNSNERCANDSGERDVCLPSSYAPAQDRLFLNRRDGTFEEISARAGINNQGRGMGVVSCDFNRDGWLDFYLANDAGANQLYLGASDMRFSEVATVAGCAFDEFGAPEGSMGVDVADYNGDGFPDIFVTNFEFEDNSLYRNDGTGLFVHASVVAGLSGRCRRYVGFGTVFADFDLDGWQDLVISNGHVQYHRPPLRQPAVLFQNQNGKRFRDVSEAAGPYFSIPHIGRGVAAGDLDNDGAIDLVIVHQNDPVSILRNRLQVPDWFGVELKGQTSNPDAIGATVTAMFPRQSLTRFVTGGGSYLSCCDPRIVFPLRDPALENSDDPQNGNPAPSIVVRWPDARSERFTGLRPHRYNLLTEGTGEPQ